MDYEIRDYNFELEEDNDGEYRIMSGEVEICANILGSIKKDINFIVDAYGIRSQLILDKKVINLEEKVLENTSQIAVKDDISTGDENPEISDIVNVFGKPVLSDYKVMEDKIEIEGFIVCNIIYFSTNSLENIFCHQTNIPVKQTIDIKGIESDSDCNIELFTEHVNYNMTSSKDAEVKFVVGVICKVYKSYGSNIIEKISEGSIDDNKSDDKRPNIIVYFVKPEDTFWEIAKKYRTTISEILKVNDLEEDDAINTGMQMLITRKSG
jgi:hypothetical protein